MFRKEEHRELVQWSKPFSFQMVNINGPWFEARSEHRLKEALRKNVAEMADITKY